MTRGIRLSVIFAIGTSLIASPIVHAHGGGGHGGGGGHMGGGHIGGGHFGGGHMGSSHMGSSHMGHTGGYQQHSGYSGQHYGSQQHFSGQQHISGQQNFSGQQTIHSGSNFGTQHLGNQHLGTQNFNGHSFSSQHNLGTQHNLGIQNQTHSAFLQNHSIHSGTALQHNNGTLNHSLANQTHTFRDPGHGFGNQTSLHQSSHFLSAHNVSSVTAAHHGSFSGNNAFNHQNGFTHQNLANHNNFHNFNNFHGNNSFNHAGWNHGYRGFGYGYPYYGYGYGLGGFGFGLGLGLGYGLGFGGLGYYGGYGLGYYGGYGLGYYGGYYGGYGGYGGYGFNNYCYGLNGYGYGLNGYGYGSYYGYPNWGCLGYQSCCAYQPIGYGYLNSLPGFGAYSAYGGYAVTNGYNGLTSSGLAYAPNSQMAALGPATATDAVNPILDTNSGAASGLPTAEEFARIGETAFKTRDYKGAVRAWRHGLVDDPQNAVLIMMLSQALFATEQFGESAGAVQAAMQTLPQDKWDVVIKNFRDLYGKGEDYTTQIRALEKAAREKPDDPSLRFLLGYHYGFLGYPAEAVKQLQKCVNLAPRDEMAQKVLRLFDDKLPKTNEPPPGPGQPPASNLQSLPTPIDFIPPPPLKTEPSNAGLTTSVPVPPPAAKPDNVAP